MKLAATIARFLQADMQAELRDLGRSGASGTRARTILKVRPKDGGHPRRFMFKRRITGPDPTQ